MLNFEFLEFFFEKAGLCPKLTNVESPLIPEQNWWLYKPVFLHMRLNKNVARLLICHHLVAYYGGIGNDTRNRRLGQLLNLLMVGNGIQFNKNFRMFTEWPKINRNEVTTFWKIRAYPHFFGLRKFVEFQEWFSASCFSRKFHKINGGQYQNFWSISSIEKYEKRIVTVHSNVQYFNFQTMVVLNRIFNGKKSEIRNGEWLMKGK